MHRLNPLGEMFDTHVWSRTGLPLPEIIEVAGLFLKFAQSVINLNALHLLCSNVGEVLSAMEHGVRKTLDPSSSAEHQKLCEDVASILPSMGSCGNA